MKIREQFMVRVVEKKSTHVLQRTLGDMQQSEIGNYNCGFFIFYVIKHSDGRQSTLSDCENTLTADTMLSAGGACTLTRDRVLYPNAKNTLSRVTMLYPVEASTMSAVRMLYPTEA